MAIEITQIDALIHPDYCLFNRVNDIPLHPNQLRLREAWDQRVNSLAENPNSVLFYYSCVNNPPLTLSQGDKDNIAQLGEYDQTRIDRYSEILGDRFINMRRTEEPDAVELRILMERGMIYDWRATQLYSYGEIYEGCVWEWNRGVKSALNIAARNCHYKSDVCRALSMTSEDYYNVSLWWLEQGFRLRP